MFKNSVRKNKSIKIKNVKIPFERMKGMFSNEKGKLTITKLIKIIQIQK